MNPAKKIKTSTAKSSGDIFADILISLSLSIYTLIIADSLDAFLC